MAFEQPKVETEAVRWQRDGGKEEGQWKGRGPVTLEIWCSGSLWGTSWRVRRPESERGTCDTELEEEVQFSGIGLRSCCSSRGLKEAGDQSGGGVEVTERRSQAGGRFTYP